jgi:hypothetical protein
MTVLKDALSAIREAIKLADDVQRIGAMVKDLSGELRDHDRRLTRLEAQWETVIILSQQQRSQSGSAQKRLEGR